MTRRFAKLLRLVVVVPFAAMAWFAEVLLQMVNAFLDGFLPESKA